METISSKDREILREVAKEKLEIAKSEAMKKLGHEWMMHNTLRGERPMIYIETNTFANEAVTPLLKCEGEKAREIEFNLYLGFINHKLFGDDYFVDDFYRITNSCDLKLFGMSEEKENTDGLGFHFVNKITDLGEEFPKLMETESEIVFDKNAALREKEVVDDIFGDILPAKITGIGLYAVPTFKLLQLMNMEDLYFAMYDYPDELKQVMDRIADDYLKMFDLMRKENAILPTVGSEWVAQGTWCFNDELPSEGVGLSSKDVWGFADSQETSGISAQMYEEFIFPCYKKITESYGLLSYGCCEAVDPIWDNCIGKLQNLRKVSISPWCNEEFMGEALKGQKTIFHRKPSPNFLGVGTALDEEAVIKHIDKTLNAAKGLKIEFTQRDVYTINNDINKVKRYIEIIRNRCEKNYK